MFLRRSLISERRLSAGSQSLLVVELVAACFLGLYAGDWVLGDVRVDAHALPPSSSRAL